MNRTLLVTNDFPPVVGGIQSYLDDYTKRLDPTSLVVLASTPPEGMQVAKEYDATLPYKVVRVDTTMLLPTANVRRRMQELIKTEHIDTVWFGAAAPLGLMAKAAKEAGAKRALPLAVSVPSHCALMKPAADQLSVSLESITLKEAGVSVLNNVDVKNEIEADAIRNALVRQLYSPVRWTETVEKMAQNGVEVLVEVGPGKVLNGLTKRIVDSLQAVSVNDVKSLDSVEEVLA